MMSQVARANTTVLNGRQLDRDLARVLHRPVRIENDANCLAVSEAVDGAGQGAHIVFAAILGTGVGAGIAIDGHAWAGAHGIAGEWGHNPAPRLPEDRVPTPHCWCGAACNETVLSGPGSPRTTCHGGALPMRVRSSTPRATATPRRRPHWTATSAAARALAQVINPLDPDVIVLCGLSNTEPMRDAGPLGGACVLRCGHHAAERPCRRLSGRGAAWLWRAHP
jgi:fructokinase